jgi:AbrB family looped-hinge helix DNA binding protein
MPASKVSNIVTFTTKGRVVIPSKLRKEFEIKVGTRAAAIATPKGILLKPVTRDYIRSLRGSLKNKKVWEAFQHDRLREPPCL